MTARLAVSRPVPILCPKCGVRVGEMIDGVPWVKAGRQWIAGARAISCWRAPKCNGIWQGDND